MNEAQSKCTWRISPDARPMTYDDIAFLLFGMTLEELVHEIRENRDGKYDLAYGRGQNSGNKPLARTSNKKAAR